MNKKMQPEKLDTNKVVALLQQKPVHRTTLLYGRAECDVDARTLIQFVQENGAFRSPDGSTAHQTHHEVYTHGEKVAFGQSQVLIYAIDLKMDQLQ